MNTARVQVLIVAVKGDDGDAIRAVTRRDHLRYMIDSQSKVAWGGAFKAPDGSWGGMALVVEGESVESVRAWLEKEPYRAAGVFSSVMVSPFQQVTPALDPDWLASELKAEEAKAKSRTAQETRQDPIT